MQSQELIKLSVDSIRTLSMDGVQQANSGHPGAPMALAPVAYTLYRRVMKHNPKNPNWFDRDRFILSNGHASMLLYSALHLSGYDLSLDDLKNFRQWSSKTPGHPEHGLTPGAETTTGPLGQGFMTGVGMAMAEAHLAARFNREGHTIVDHHTYVICSDGDLMEGASHEAASVAGHLGLGKLICLYDDNHITIEGDTALAFSEDIPKRFESYGWQVINLGEQANDVDAIEAAFEEGKSDPSRPTMIILRTHIGYGSPNKVDTSGVHGSPLGHEEIALTKAAYGWPSTEPFHVPAAVREHMEPLVAAGAGAEAQWQEALRQYQNKYPALAQQFDEALQQDLAEGWDAEIPTFGPEDGPIATRAINSHVLNSVAEQVPWIIGGSADLEPSTKTKMKSYGYFSKDDPTGRNIAWGIRELAMCAASTGMQLHGGVRPYCATFFVFTDYARPAIRLAALMEQPVIYVMTHDSVGLGEDGPTHQPIEQLASFRVMPNLTVIRPADANETTHAWRVAIRRREGPTMLVLTRQKLPVLDPAQVAAADGVARGGYIIRKEQGDRPDAIIIATGSEVDPSLGAQSLLTEQGIDARVVSMPSTELFQEQPPAYRDEVLPPDVWARVSVEAGATMSWRQYIGDRGVAIGIDRFGLSAPYKLIMERFGFTPENIATQVKSVLASQ